MYQFKTKRILAFLCLFLIFAMVAISEGNYKCKAQYDANNNPVYVGLAAPGTSVTAAKWQITKYTWDANGNMLSQDWAEGSDEFRFKWTLRTGYNYH